MTATVAVATTVGAARRYDRLGLLLAAAAAVALLLPFVLFKVNRIVPGDPRTLLAVLPGAAGYGWQRSRWPVWWR